MEEYNTIIIGSGIAGMTAAIYLKRAGINTLIIEKSAPGGELNKATYIENYPGFDKITGSDLAINIYNQVTNLNVDYLFEEVLSVDFNKNTLKTDTKTFKYTNLIIANGRRNRCLNLPNEDKYIGRGISFCASCDGNLYKDKEVIVIGGANSALSEVLYLSNICKKVTLIYRKDELRGEKILQDRLRELNNISIIYNANVIEYLFSDKITGIRLDNGSSINADCIFLAIGYVPNSDIYDLKKSKGYIITDKKYQTNVKNVYACGDIIKKDLYQLVTSASEGAIVANNIIKGN